MRLGNIVVLTAFLVGCATHQQALPPATNSNANAEPALEGKVLGEDSIMTKQALKSYRENYSHASTHKAFAQSGSGAWSWKSNRTSVEYAIQNSLISCQKNNKRHETEYPCKIINVDGEWIGER